MFNNIVTDKVTIEFVTLLLCYVTWGSNGYNKIAILRFSNQLNSQPSSFQLFYTTRQ